MKLMHGFNMQSPFFIRIFNHEDSAEDSAPNHTRRASSSQFGTVRELEPGWVSRATPRYQNNTPCYGARP